MFEVCYELFQVFNILKSIAESWYYIFIIEFASLRKIIKIAAEVWIVRMLKSLCDPDCQIYFSLWRSSNLLMIITFIFKEDLLFWNKSILFSKRIILLFWSTVQVHSPSLKYFNTTVSTLYYLQEKTLEVQKIFKIKNSEFLKNSETTPETIILYYWIDWFMLLPDIDVL